MPTYTYVCDNCGEEVEAFQSMSDAPLKKCPACKKMKLRRTFHPVGIVLKGSGFHRNDYRTNRKPSKSESSESASESSSGESKSSETKTETKTEKKTETPKKSESKAPEKK
jgi:putative FmdB family regulatory protein